MHDADSAPESFLAELAALRQQHAALAAALADHFALPVSIARLSAHGAQSGGQGLNL